MSDNLNNGKTSTCERIAALAGFSEDGNATNHLEIRIDATPDSDPDEPLFGTEDIDPEEPISRMSFIRNPSQKTVLFVVGAVAIVLLGSIALWQKQSPTKVVENSPLETKPEGTDEFLAVKKENGELKGDLAVGKQGEKLLQFNESTRKNQLQKKVKSRASEVRSGKQSPTHHSPPPAPPTPPAIRRTPAYIPHTTLLGRQVQRVPQVQRVDVPIQKKPDIDPQQAWLEAASLGNQGEVRSRASEVGSQKSEVKGRSDADIGGRFENTDEYSPRHRVTASNPPPTSDFILPTTDFESSDELPVLEERVYSVKQVEIGTVAPGELIDALAWDTEGFHSQNYSTIRLSKPLLDSDKTIVIPEGALLVGSLNPSSSGFISLSVQFVLIEGEEGLQEIPLSPQAISIRAPNGKPIVAKRVSPNDNNGNLGGILIDGLGTAASFLLKDDNSYRQFYRVDQIREFYERHFGGQENRQFARNNNSSFWMLKAGMKVEVYVNRPIIIRE